ncbi:MAG: phosphoribosylaminoimidazolesuccinocarboxamide synthase [Acidobacteria bacterium]|nr:phosphoribosylaminoimidazolesuccinocarboxamide synthase [Acidobacteriota bacterium]
MNVVPNVAAANLHIPGLKYLRSGKVRDIYEADENHLVIIASDRISAFDCVLPNTIPYKGQVLTQLSRFWFERFANVVSTHLVETDVEKFPADLLKTLSSESKSALAGRAMLVNRTEVVPFECVVRGYLAGSGWKDYVQTGVVCGHRLPEGLPESGKLPEPIFTPATKAETGHDINVSLAEMSAAIGEGLANKLEAISLQIYKEAADLAAKRGIIICDTKFEFGIRDGQIVWIDEALTPDSSRFWPQASYSPGKSQPSFDKQYVRDYLETLDWDKRPPAPALPDDVVTATSQKYLEAYQRITGHTLPIV